jgi:hypothetical protein
VTELSDRTIRVDYEYLKTHAQFWKNQVNSEHARVLQAAAQFSLAGGVSGVMPRLFTFHDQLVQFFREAAHDGQTATYHIAERLELIQKWYEQNQERAAALLRTTTGAAAAPPAAPRGPGRRP